MQLEKDILQVIAEHLGVSPEDVEKGALLREDLNLGPIELNDLLGELSLKFNITFEPSEIEHLSRVEDLIMMVEDHLLEE